MTISAPGVRAVFTPMVENYRTKLIDRLRPYMSPEQLDRAAGVTDGS